MEVVSHASGIHGLELVWIALSLFLVAMSKGGFPVGSIAIPFLILAWPGQAQPARAAVAFMLPMLCIMDIGAVTLYRKHIAWKRILALLPGTLMGVLIASVIFISDQHTLITITDAALRILIGILGLCFSGWFAARRWILPRLQSAPPPGRIPAFLYGLTAGITSSLAHAAGPVLQMVLLPQRLSKLEFAGTTAGYFFLLNLIKMVPFTLLGRIDPDHVRIGLMMFPIIPVGVIAGFGMVRITRDHHYTAFIQAVLAITSVILIMNGLRG